MHALHAFHDLLTPVASIDPATGFVRIRITAGMVVTAEGAAKALTAGMAERNFRNSILRGGGNFAGCLGEEVLIAAIQGAASGNTFNHDVDICGVRVEVKTKQRSVPPRPDFMASVCNKNTAQKAHAYCFVSLVGRHGGFTEGYICGLILPEDFYAVAAPMGLGDVDPTDLYERRSLQGTGIKEDCWNLPYADLLNPP